MTERDVVIQTEVEESIQVCDECGLADDSENLETWRANEQLIPDIHLHPECRRSWAVESDEDSGPTYADEIRHAVEDSHRVDPVLVMGKIDVLAILVGVAFSLIAYFAYSRYVPAFIMFVLWSFIFLFFAIVRSNLTAHEAAKNIGRNK